MKKVPADIVHFVAQSPSTQMGSDGLGDEIGGGETGDEEWGGVKDQGNQGLWDDMW